MEKLGKKVTFSNCYVLEINDDSIESIFQTASDTARTFSYGGGVGIDLSKLSPRGATIHNAAKSTTGAVSFMDLYSLVSELIGSHGRRGALMLSLDCTHPDLEEFITVKNDPDKVTKANISVRMTDEFMGCAGNDQDFNLHFYRPESDQHIDKTINAKDMLMKLAEMNWNMGEPGVLFWDRIEEYNLMSEDDSFKYSGVNPCLTGDMKLLTKYGYKTFLELCDTQFDIVNVDGNITTGKVWHNGKKETISLVLSNREVINCTPDHVFMTVDGDECMAKDLKTKKIMPFLNFRSFVDKKFVKYGFIQGDGQLKRLASEKHKGLEVNIGSKDGDIRSLFSDENFTNRNDNRHMYITGFNEPLTDLGFSEQTMLTRVFPTTYNEWNILEKASFLQGCYSANGCVVKNNRLSYKTICKEFADQLSETLLNDFGIPAYITTNKPKVVTFSNGDYECKQSYDVNISAYSSVVKFAELINFYQQYKRTQLRDMILFKTPKVSSIRDNGIQDVYDFSEPERHWGSVNGFVTHNCGR